MIGNFKIMTTVYNAQKYVKKCVDSVKLQTYKNWKMLIVNDCSTDDTSNIINNETKNDDRFIVVHNTENKKALQNYVEQIPILCNNDEDIIISIDGDDWLYSNDVFEYLNKVYEENIWFTYGSYRTTTSPNSPDCNRPFNPLTTRNRGVNFSHLKTWKYHIWKKIKDDDFKINGKYLTTAWDTPITLPITEMSGNKRVKYIEKIMYIYNNDNPLNDYKVDEKLQMLVDSTIRNRPRYLELP